MPKYVIEREIPGAGRMTPEELTSVADTSREVLRQLGTQIQWVHSYVTGDKIYCLYIAPNEELIREHARLGKFPANRISEVTSIIDPTSTAALVLRGAWGRPGQYDVQVSQQGFQAWATSGVTVEYSSGSCPMVVTVTLRADLEPAS